MGRVTQDKITELVRVLEIMEGGMSGFLDSIPPVPYYQMPDLRNMLY